MNIWPLRKIFMRKTRLNFVAQHMLFTSMILKIKTLNFLNSNFHVNFSVKRKLHQNFHSNPLILMILLGNTSES